ncbi:MAG: phosphate signaling complex protein PhoU [Chloroflexi bacterium]|nr:phosphate signaling complex protein PhoU [Chloroflexota bacterium]
MTSRPGVSPARADFDRHLRQLQDELLALGSMVEKAVTKAIHALKARDIELSRQVIKEDDLIDTKRFQLEEQCVELIATQQPLARDLRVIISVLHISVELERMGDYAEGIGKISLMMGEEPPLKPLIDIPRMTEKSLSMLRRSLDALVNRDAAAAMAVCKDDDEVDALYNQVYRELIFFMLQDPKTVQRATYLLWVAHDLERLADRATNVAERVIFLVTGKMVEINVSKY